MRFEILTLFPGYFDSPLRQGVIGRAVADGAFQVGIRNIRDFATDRRSTADDAPYGGGGGMVMKVEPLSRAVEAVTESGGPRPTVVLMTPQGERFDHGVAQRLSGLERIVLICGRYEGFDERVRSLADMELSIGDYVLSGGEAAALVVVEAVARLLPGVLGCEDSARRDSFVDGLLEGPQYTRPEEYRGMRVPAEILSGNHAEIRRWRREQSIRRTFERRPDLIETASLSDEERALVEELKRGE